MVGRQGVGLGNGPLGIQIPRSKRLWWKRVTHVEGDGQSDKGVVGLGERIGGDGGKRLRRRGWY